MSDEQAASGSTAQPDDSEPTPERQAELRATYEANVAHGKPPYAGAVIHTRGEVNWLIKERTWLTSDLDSIEQAIDFRSVGIHDAVLNDVDLSFANLSGAIISNSKFHNAKLIKANLSGISIVDDTDFSGANLGYVNLTNADVIAMNMLHKFVASTNPNDAFVRDMAISFRGADLRGANLSNASLFGIDFSYAKLHVAKLCESNVGISDFSNAWLDVTNLNGAVIAGNFCGADLTQARMDANTLLGEASSYDEPLTFRLDGRTRLLDVAWNGAILANVRWEQVTRLGDEADIKAAKSRTERVKALRNAARSYRGLAKALHEQGLIIPALNYRLRERQLERRALLYTLAVGPWLFSWLLNLVSGYGDKPGRALASYLAVVTSFTAAYWAVTNQIFGSIQSGSAHLVWYEALVLSISSFHGRGFFPTMLTLGDPIALIAAAEAILGLFIELVFIATFTQRFFAR